MFNIHKFLVLTVSALTLTLSGTVFAGSISQTAIVEESLYGQPNPFSAVDENLFAAVDDATSNAGQVTESDRQIHGDLQKANMAQTLGSAVWELVPSKNVDAENDDLHSPE